MSALFYCISPLLEYSNPNPNVIFFAPLLSLHTLGAFSPRIERTMRRVSNFYLPVAPFALSVAYFAPKAQSSFHENDGIEYIFDGTDDFSTSKSTVMMAIFSIR